jgi:hypothetical protein
LNKLAADGAAPRPKPGLAEPDLVGAVGEVGDRHGIRRRCGSGRCQLELVYPLAPIFVPMTKVPLSPS